jgi:hypothetical protein
LERKNVGMERLVEVDGKRGCEPFVWGFGKKLLREGDQDDNVKERCVDAGM